MRTCLECLEQAEKCDVAANEAPDVSWGNVFRSQANTWRALALQARLQDRLFQIFGTA